MERSGETLLIWFSILLLWSALVIFCLKKIDQSHEKCDQEAWLSIDAESFADPLWSIPSISERNITWIISAIWNLYDISMKFNWWTLEAFNVDDVNESWKISSLVLWSSLMLFVCFLSYFLEEMVVDCLVELSDISTCHMVQVMGWHRGWRTLICSILNSLLDVNTAWRVNPLIWSLQDGTKS
jgi:hypothetical protein